jgi:hypothetical protein
MNSFAEYIREIRKSLEKGDSTEHTHRTALEALLESCGKDIDATNEPRRIACGALAEIWNFHIGGYQVCEKWLKDRKGRKLTYEDTRHYQRIVVALNETIRDMTEIDEVIRQHGDWPTAFSGNNT